MTAGSSIWKEVQFWNGKDNACGVSEEKHINTVTGACLVVIRRLDAPFWSTLEAASHHRWIFVLFLSHGLLFVYRKVLQKPQVVGTKLW